MVCGVYMVCMSGMYMVHGMCVYRWCVMVYVVCVCMCICVECGVYGVYGVCMCICV